MDVAEKTDGKIKYIAERPGSYSLVAPLLRQGKDEDLQEVAEAHSEVSRTNSPSHQSRRPSGPEGLSSSLSISGQSLSMGLSANLSLSHGAVCSAFKN